MRHLLEPREAQGHGPPGAGGLSALSATNDGCRGHTGGGNHKVREAALVGDFERGASYVSDLSIKNCSVCGTPEGVIPQIEAMIRAGVDHVCFGHPLGPDFNEALALLGKDVLPHFRN